MNKINLTKVDDQIAITGMAGYFPECRNVEELKTKLFDGTNMVTSDPARYPEGTYGLHTYGGKVRYFDDFDAGFFGINGKQANSMDPQVRVLLELVFAAILDAGYNPAEFRGSNTSVFVGSTSADAYDYLISPDNATGYELIGGARCMLANRISYVFDFHGPSMVVDEACSSSLTATQMAVDSIQTGRSDAAIAVGTNILLNPNGCLQFLKLGVFGKECKSFDKDGHGYVRSEAVPVILLQKTQDARRIYATVVGIKSNNDGHKVEGPTFPSIEGQFNLLKEIYTEAAINPDDLFYVEAHGTGTSVGDMVEGNSLSQMFCETNRKQPLYVGSAKSNLGHTETASGLVGVVKVLLAMENFSIPPNLHFKEPNPNIPALLDGRMKVVVKQIAFDEGLAGVSSVGIGGTNAHMVLRPHKKRNVPYKSEEIDNTLIVLSSRTEEGINHLLEAVKLNHNNLDFIGLLNKIHEININRHPYRAFAVLGKKPVQEVNRLGDEKRPLWFVYAGMGSQWPGMAKELMGMEVFRKTIEKCAEVLRPHGIDLVKVITTSGKAEVDEVANSFASIIAVEVALTDLLFASDIRPDGIVGHSLGEIGAAYCDGCLTAEQAVLVAYYRAKAVEDTILIPGLMASVGLSWEECQKRCPPDIYPACNNAPDNVTVSGPKESVEEFVNRLKSKKIFAKIVNTAGIAFHSKYIDDAAPKLLKYLKQVIPRAKERSPKWISSSILKKFWDGKLAKTCSAEYQTNNFESPVHFYNAVKEIPKNALLVEIAPHCLLQGLVKRSVSPDATVLGLVNKDVSDLKHNFMTTMGRLHIHGYLPNVSLLQKQIEFPVPRGTPMISNLVKWDHSEKYYTPCYKPDDKKFGIDISVKLNDKEANLQDYKIDGKTIFPAVGFLWVAWKALATALQRNYDEVPISMENVKFADALVIEREEELKFLVNLLKISGHFEVSHKDRVFCTGHIRRLSDCSSEFTNLLPMSKKLNFIVLQPYDVYKKLSLMGYEYEASFRGVKTIDNTCESGELLWNDKFPEYLDTLVQCSLVGKDTKDLLLLDGIDKVVIDPKVHVEQVKTMDGEKYVQLNIYKDLNIIKSGGIEIWQPYYKKHPRHNILQHNHRKDRYTFVPDDRTTKEVANYEKIQQEVLSTSLQIISENCGSELSICELCLDVENALTPLVKKLVDLEVGIRAQFIFIATEDSERCKEILVSRGMENTEIVSEPDESSANLLITKQVLGNIDVTEYANFALKDGGFLLLVEDSEEAIDFAKFDENDYDVITRNKVGRNVLILLRKRINLPKNYTVVYVTPNNFSWIKNLKNAIANEQYARVYLVASVPEMHGIIGMFNSLKLESKCAHIRLYVIYDTGEIFDFDNSVFATRIKKDLKTNIFRDGVWGSRRNLKIPDDYKKVVEHRFLDVDAGGNCKWIERNFINEENKSICRVTCGVLTTEDLEEVRFNTGIEKVKKSHYTIGKSFSGFNANGERIMGITPGPAVATSAIFDDILNWKVPENWSLEEAATVSLPYSVAYYVLTVKAQVHPSTNILVIGDDVISLTSAFVAQQLGCKVLISSSNQQEMELVQKCPKLKHGLISEPNPLVRKQEILNKTNGRGVDIILNFAKTLSCTETLVNAGSYYLINAKADVSENAEFANIALKNNIRFYVISTGDILEENSSNKETIAKFINDGLKSGTVAPLPIKIFQEDHMKNALEELDNSSMAVIKLPEGNTETLLATPSTYFSGDKSYIMIGGFGRLGLELIDWMISRGARKFVVNSRSGIKSGYQSWCFRVWTEKGIQVEKSTDNVSTQKGAATLIDKATELGPVGGIFILSTTTTEDGLFENQTELNFTKAFQSKVTGTKMLDRLSREKCHELDFFVGFSCIASSYGNPGQTNFSMANQVLESICEERFNSGLPGKAIQLGPIRDVDMEHADHTFSSCFYPQSIPSVLATIDEFLQRPEPVLCSYLIVDKNNIAEVAENDEELSTKYLKVVAEIMNIKDVDAIGQNETLADLGLDSLMLIDIINVFYEDFGLDLDAGDLMYMTIGELRTLGLENGHNFEILSA